MPNPYCPYRYTLNRRWGPGPRLLWIMLNPSMADHRHDDPTIRRVRAFSEEQGYHAFVVANLFARRATKPDELRPLSLEDRIGPLNDRWLVRLFQRHTQAVAAWGSSPIQIKRGVQVEGMAGLEGCNLLALGFSQQGFPRHPLFVRSGTPLEELTL